MAGPGAILGMGFSLFSGFLGMSAAKDAERRARQEANRLNTRLKQLENNRQDIINPYDGIKDLSAFITNPYANLGVATQAAEMQAEEVDLSLASTLDTIRATCSGAGGATALAQAALRSKKSISASIEQQEANNEKLRAQGEQTRQQALRQEQMRLQEAEVAGEQFMFQTREQRQMQELDRTAALLGAARSAEAQAGADSTQALTGMFGSLASMAGTLFGKTD